MAFFARWERNSGVRRPVRTLREPVRFMPGAPGRILGAGSHTVVNREDAVRLFMGDFFRVFVANK